MVVKFFPFTLYHAKNNVGSTRIRVEKVIENWPEASLYKYGDKADVMIFQKVYVTHDFKMIKNYPAIKILDTCDLDWNESPGVYIKETLDAVDAVTVPTEELRKFLQSMTQTPVVIVKDRFDVSEFPTPKKHTGDLRSLVWFGYYQNSEVLKYAMGAIERRGLRLTVISNEDPIADRWASPAYSSMYTFVKYDQDTIYQELQKHDACLLPKGMRPQDRFKSENKTIIAQLCGLPVAQYAEDLDELKTADARNKNIEAIYDTIKEEYNVVKSVQQYKEIIREIQSR